MKLNYFKNLLQLPLLRNTLNRQYSKKIRKYESSENIAIRPPGFYHEVKPWIEQYEVKKHVKKRRKRLSMDMSTRELKAFMSGMRDLPINPEELRYWLARRKETREVLEQEFLPERVILLRSDLAAAHFIVNRGGAVRFYGDPRWVGIDREIQTLPDYYTPGLYVEYIDAVGTRLQYEGLMNIMGLRRLRWLCLSGLQKFDNFCLDLISSEYCNQLSYLDISHCTAVDHNGLSCMYRFEKLKTFDVSGISASPDFKMACSMLEDVLPKLEILGVDYTLPENKYTIDTNQFFFK